MEPQVLAAWISAAAAAVQAIGALAAIWVSVLIARRSERAQQRALRMTEAADMRARVADRAEKEARRATAILQRDVLIDQVLRAAGSTPAALDALITSAEKLSARDPFTEMPFNWLATSSPGLSELIERLLPQVTYPPLIAALAELHRLIGPEARDPVMSRAGAVSIELRTRRNRILAAIEAVAAIRSTANQPPTPPAVGKAGTSPPRTPATR